MADLPLGTPARRRHELMNTPQADTVPISPALANLAFASASDSQVSRSLAWTSPGDLGIDLDDPAQRRFG